MAAAKTNNNEETPIVGKVHFPKDVLFGREQELSQLLSTYQRLTTTSTEASAAVADESSRSQLLFIGGPSGSGKSRLVQEFQKQISSKDTYFLTGKSDELLQSEPCSSLVDAFSAWCEQIINQQQYSSSTEERDTLRDAIQTNVGEERGKVLTKLIPSLSSLLMKQQPDDGDGDDGDCEPEQLTDRISELNRLKNAFELFIRAISRKERPIILFLDDMQWIDPVSLDLISKVAINPSVRHFMLIGAYRDDEVDEEHELAKCLQKIRQQGKAIVTLSLGNLGPTKVTEMVARAMQMQPSSKTQELAEALFTKTNGNPLYIESSLLSLERNRVVSYSFAKMKWTWEMGKVAEALAVTESVVYTILANLESLDAKLQMVLVVASLLRSTFHIEVLFGVLQQQQLPPNTREELQDLLEMAVRENFLQNSIGSSRYKFSHDRVQQACKMLAPVDQQHACALAVGRFLLNNSSDIRDYITDTEQLFLAVEIFNGLPLRFITGEEEFDIIQLVQWNLEVGIISCRQSAFAVAHKYLHTAIDLAETQVEGLWEQHYELCLRLYNTASAVEYTVGTFEKAKRYSDQVIENAKNYDDKLPAYQALSNGLGQRQRHFDALTIDKEVLRSSGQPKLNTNMFNVLWQLGTLKKRLKSISDEEVLALPAVTDKKIIIAMETLSKMSTRAFYCDQLFKSLLCTIRQIQLTLDHGLTQASSYAFAGYGNVCCMALGEMDLADRMIDLSYELVKVTKAGAYQAKVLFTTTNFVKSWQRPLPSLIDAFDRGYHAGIAAGDMEFACLSHLAYTIHFALAGLPLSIALSDCEELESLIKHYDVEAVKVVLEPFQSMLMSLAGKQKDPLKYFTEKVRFPEKKSDVSKSLTLKLLSAALYGMQTAYFFNELERADQLRFELDKYIHAELSYSALSQHMMFSALISTALFRKTGNGSHLKIVRKMLKEGKKLMARKGMNLLHKYKIIEADLKATTSTKTSAGDVKESFDEAITTASRTGFMQDAAIANELCGEYHIRMKDDFWAKHYLSRALELYNSWGALGKARLLVENRGEYMDSVAEEASKGMKSIRTGRLGLTNRTIKQMNEVNTSTAASQNEDGSSSSTNMMMESATFHTRNDVFSTDSSSFSLSKARGAGNSGTFKPSDSSSVFGTGSAASTVSSSGLETMSDPLLRAKA